MPTNATGILVGSDPGFNYFRRESVSAWTDIGSNGPCQIYAYTLRNASTSPVFVNFYHTTTNVQVGGVGSTKPSFRQMVPGALDASNPGMVQIIADAFPIRTLSGACSIAPVLTDTDGAALGGTLSYVEIQWSDNKNSIT